MEATILDVARYIVKKIAPTTAMKLEKLTYYCQAWSLAWDEVPLFNEDFEAWANGPVCPMLYDEHRGIYNINNMFLSKRADYPFTETQKETMDKVIEYYGNKEPQWLSDLTHQELPWREARIGVPMGERSRNIVTKDSMQQYYGGLQ